MMTVLFSQIYNILTAPARGLGRRTMKDILEKALYEIEDGEDVSFESIYDIQEQGYLTNDEGLVVKLSDGRKFIITIQEV